MIGSVTGVIDHSQIAMAQGRLHRLDRKNYLRYITGDEVHAKHRELHWQLFHTNFKSFVEIQQCLFANLCNKATPAGENQRNRKGN
jgi:hypothetical protein